jgi:uncharacterized protein Yka (UPF0111/DUF47 family)
MIACTCRPNDKSCANKDTTFEDEASDLKILKFMTDLHKIALIDGGGVYSILGNHEIMNVRGLEHDLDYVSYEGLKQFMPKNTDIIDVNNIKSIYYILYNGKYYL